MARLWFSDFRIRAAVRVCADIGQSSRPSRGREASSNAGKRLEQRDGAHRVAAGACDCQWRSAKRTPSRKVNQMHTDVRLSALRTLTELQITSFTLRQLSISGGVL